MFVIGVAVFGMVSLGQLPLDLLPTLQYPTLTVRTEIPGGSPEDVEERVTENLVEQLGTLRGLVRASSVSRAEMSDVTLEFRWGIHVPFAVADVRERLDRVMLPAEAERPVILRYDPSQEPILRLGMTGAGGDPVRLRLVADEELRRALESIEGVARVRVRGGIDEEIRVSLDPDRLLFYGLSPDVIGARLAGENQDAAGGVLREGNTEYLVRTLGAFQGLDEIRSVVVGSVGGVPLRVSDVADVARVPKEQEELFRMDGVPAVEIDIYREAGQNLVRLADEIRRRLFVGDQAAAPASGGDGRGGRSRGAAVEPAIVEAVAARARIPDLEVTVLSDPSAFVRDALSEVGNAALYGALFATLVLYLFLRRPGATLVVALSIPVSVVATFAPMFLLDVTLNVMSLGGLALGVGLLVDNSIVVLEAITRRREEGDDAHTAAIRGAGEVAGAVTASTLTTVCVFLPIVFVEGIAAQIFRDQAVTVVSSLLVSLVVSLTFIPTLAARLGSGEARPTGRSRNPLLRTFDAVWGRVEERYPRLLGGAMARPGRTLGVAVMLFVGASYLLPRLGSELLPDLHQGEFTAEITLEPRTPLAGTDAVARELEGRVRALDSVATTALIVGADREETGRQGSGRNTARLTVRLPESVTHDLVAAEEAAERDVRALVESDPRIVNYRITRPTLLTLAPEMEIEVYGSSREEVRAASLAVGSRLEAMEGLSDVRTTVGAGVPEVRIVFDREACLRYGITPAACAQLLRDEIEGTVPTTLGEGNRRVDIRVRAAEDAVDGIEKIEALVVNPGAAVPVLLSSVATIERGRAPAEIRRIRNARVGLVRATRTGIDLGGLTSRVEAMLGSLDLPPNVTARVGGQREEMDAALGALGGALALALVLVTLVLAALFESVVRPLAVLLTVPLAAVGAILGLWLLGVPISVVVLIGFILLAGIVVNNAIVMVDRVARRRREGMAAAEAIVDGARARLRPILMTTLTTVLGLIPLTGWIGALGGGEGAEMRAPMAVTVVFGLALSTLLTLLVVPAALSLLERDRRPS